MDMINIPAIDIIMQSIGSGDARENGDMAEVTDEMVSTRFLDIMSAESIPIKGVGDSQDIAELAEGVLKIAVPDVAVAKSVQGFGVAIQQPESAQLPPVSDLRQSVLMPVAATATVTGKNGALPVPDNNTALPIQQNWGIVANQIATPIGSDEAVKSVKVDAATISEIQTIPAKQVQMQPQDTRGHPVKTIGATLGADQSADKAAIILPTAGAKTKATEYLPVKGEPATSAKPTGPSIIPDLKTAQTSASLDTTKPSFPKSADLSVPHPAPIAPHALLSTIDLPQSTPLDAVTKVIPDQRSTQIIAAPEYPLGNAQTYLRPTTSPVSVPTPAEILPMTGPHPQATTNSGPVAEPLHKSALLVPSGTQNADISIPPPIPQHPAVNTNIISDQQGTQIIATTDKPSLQAQVFAALAPAQITPVAGPPVTDISPPPKAPTDLVHVKSILVRSETTQADPATPNTPTPAPQPEQGPTAQNTTAFAMPEQIIGADDIMPLMTDIRQTDALVPRLDTFTPRPEVARHIAQQLANIAQQMPDRPIELTLNPEELGRVRLTFTMTDGGISVAVLAERGETMDLMRRHIETLAQEFRNQGYKDVNFEFARNGQQGNAGSGQGANGRGESNDQNATATNTFADPDLPPPVKLSLEPATGLDMRL